MKHAQSYVALLGALLLTFSVLGCGGSGGGGTTTGPTIDPSKPRIEAIVQVTSANLKHPANWTADQLNDPTNLAVKADLIDATVFGYQDPTNFQAQENYVFELVKYVNGTRVILPAVWQSSDLTGFYGNLGVNSGVFYASTNTTNADQEQSIQATYNGSVYSAKYDIKQREARILGHVLQVSSNAPIPGVMVDFYDSSTGLTIGSVTSATDGSFRASVPAGSASSVYTFAVDPHSLSTSYQSGFEFAGVTYPLDARAPLQPLVVGTQLLGYDATNSPDGQPVYIIPAS